ncbi:MAG: nucleotidyltransferase family protein [Caldisericia bacterium]
MNNFERIKEILKQNKKELERKYKVKYIAIFGSYVRGEQNERSDIDILVDFRENGKTFDNYMDLKFYLENLLNIKVDLIMEGALKENVKKLIMDEIEYV